MDRITTESRKACTRIGGARLIWLYDIHLLIDTMSPRELMEFARLAENKGMRTICCDGLLQARQCFGTRVPEEVLRSLSRTGPTEPSAAHLRAGSMRHLLTELRSLSRWRYRITLLGEHLFPPPATCSRISRSLTPPGCRCPVLQRRVQGNGKRIHNS